MTNKRKALMTVLAAMLLVTMSVFGTLAYLTSTDSVENTFTVGNVTITLDEALVDANGKTITGDGAARVDKNTYKLMPGHDYDKDPTVHVAANSEDCYLFVKVVDEIAAIQDAVTVANQMNANGWTLIDATNGIYVYGTDKDKEPTTVAKSATITNVPVFKTFKIKGEVTNDLIAEYKDKKITVTAYAVQKDGFENNTPAGIWNTVFNAQ